MKRLVLIVSLLIMGLNSVNANSWRVCSRIGSGAQFASIAAADSSALVQIGDTLILDAGHNEPNSLTVSKALTIIGPGFNLANNGHNTINTASANIVGSMTLSSGCKIYGCNITSTLTLSSNTVVNRCRTTGISVATQSSNISISGCYVRGSINCATSTNMTISNNIVLGRIYSLSHSTIANNTVVSDGTSYSIISASYSVIVNNIVINTYSSYPNRTIYYDANNTVANNVLSGTSIDYSYYAQTIRNATISDVLKCTGVEEEYYEHKADGLAASAGINGTPCGAYGSYNGSTPYQKSGIPMGSPYIYDATFDAQPSATNTINAQFKIKVKNE